MLLSDEPDAPGTPEIDDWDSDHVDISWTAPKNDGGAPITSYLIEKKDRFSINWSKAADSPGTGLSCTVRWLRQNQEYQFRVRAINKAGPSKPSEVSRAVIAKPRYGMC